MKKKLTEKALELIIERLYAAHGKGRMIGLLDISKIFAAGALAAERHDMRLTPESLREIDTAVADAVAALTLPAPGPAVQS